MMTTTMVFFFLFEKKKKMTTIVVIFLCGCVTMMKVMATTIAFLGDFATKKATTGVNIII
jgi:hypothetical protein